MNAQTRQPIYAVATLGPEDQPNKRVAVEVIGQSDTKDFFLCLNKDQEILKVHILKLILIWVP